MSCRERLTKFLGAVACGGSAVANALGGPEEAQKVLEQVFKEGSLPPKTPAEARLAEANTLALFESFDKNKVERPVHSRTGLPNKASQGGYSLLRQTLNAIALNRPLPPAAQEVIERAAKQRTIQAVARDKRGRFRCTNCGQYARQGAHLCQHTATGEALQAKLQRSFKVPASAYPPDYLESIVTAARQKEGLSVRHATTGERANVTLDGLALAMANGFMPEDVQAPKTVLAKLPNGRVLQVVNAEGLQQVEMNTPQQQAAALSGAAIGAAETITSATDPLVPTAPPVVANQGTAVVGGQQYDRGRFFGTEFRKKEAKGREIEVMGHKYVIGTGSGNRADWGTARTTGVCPPPAFGEIVAGRTLVVAAGILAEGQVVETESTVEVYSADGNLLAVYDPSAGVVGDTEGIGNASAAQMAAVIAHRTLHPQTAEEAALVADLVQLKEGKATPLKVSDAAYIALSDGVFRKGRDLMMGGTVAAGRCADCGQFTGSAPHVCKAKQTAQTEPVAQVEPTPQAEPSRPRRRRPAPTTVATGEPVVATGAINVQVDAPVSAHFDTEAIAEVLKEQVASNVHVQLEAPQVTAQLDAAAFTAALREGLAGLAPSAPAAVASGDMAELRNAITEMAKTVQSMAQQPVQPVQVTGQGVNEDRLIEVLERLAATRPVVVESAAAPTATPVASPEAAPAQPRARRPMARTAPEPTPEDKRTPQEQIFARVRRAEPDPSLSAVDPRIIDPNMTWSAESIPPVDPDYYLNEQSTKILKSMAAMLAAGAAGGKENRTRAFSVYGPPGTGKNKLLEQLAASVQTVDKDGNMRQGIHYEEVDITPDSDPERLIGGTVLVSDGRGGTETKVRLGPIGQAVAMGSVVALNEVVRNPRMLTAFQSMLEKGYFQIEAPELGIVRIPVHPATIMAMTWNPGLEGDADRPAMAPLSRTAAFQLERATPAEQAAQVDAYFATFPQEMRPAKIETDTAVSFFNAVADMVNDSKIGRMSRSRCVPGPRELNNFVLLGREVGWETALETMKVYCDQNAEDFAPQWRSIKAAYEMRFGEIGTNGSALYNVPQQA